MSDANNFVFPPVPSLSPDGWIVDPVIKADRMIAHFFAANPEQTAIYKGNVYSIQNLIANYQNDPDVLALQVKTALANYFSRYFNNVIVDANTIDASSFPQAPTGTQVLQIYVSMYDPSSGQFDLTKTFGILNSKILNIVSLNNTGLSSSST